MGLGEGAPVGSLGFLSELGKSLAASQPWVMADGGRQLTCLVQYSCPEPGHGPLWVGGQCGSDQNEGREHFPRVGVGLATGLDRDASCPTPGRLGRQELAPVIPVPCLSRHLFAIANLAFAKMLDAKQNQCIIIR